MEEVFSENIEDELDVIEIEEDILSENPDVPKFGIFQYVFIAGLLSLSWKTFSEGETLVALFFLVGVLGLFIENNYRKKYFELHNKSKSLIKHYRELNER